MIIYKITNKINGKCYIGQTSLSTKERWARHCEPSSKCYGLSNAIKKYGKDNFIIEILAEYRNQEDLNNAEEHYIRFYNCLTPNGYNLTKGGKYESLSEESRKKSSLTHKKMFQEGKTPWLPKKGESRSPETQFKKGVSTRTGSKWSEETRKHLIAKGGLFTVGKSAPNKGRKKQIIDGKVRYIKVEYGR